MTDKPATATAVLGRAGQRLTPDPPSPPAAGAPSPATAGAARPAKPEVGDAEWKLLMRGLLERADYEHHSKAGSDGDGEP